MKRCPHHGRLAAICLRDLSYGNPQGLSAHPHSKTALIGDIWLELTSDCVLMTGSVHEEAREPLVVPLDYPASCDFVQHRETDAVKIVSVDGSDVGFVQSHAHLDPGDHKFGCDTFVAAVVSPSGDVRVGKTPNGGSGCPPIARDRLAFEIAARRDKMPLAPCRVLRV